MFYFLRFVQICTGQKNLIAFLTEHFIHSVDRPGRSVCTAVRKDDTDAVGVFCPYGVCMPTSSVTRLLYYLQHFLPRYFTDISRLIEHARDRRTGDPGHLSYIFDRPHLKITCTHLSF